MPKTETSKPVSLKDLRKSIRAFTEQTYEAVQQLKEINRRLKRLNEQWDEGLTVFSERAG